MNARRRFEAAVDLAPAFAGGLAGLSETFAITAELGYTRARETVAKKAREFAEAAVAADDTFPAAHRAQSAAAFLTGAFETAISASQRAVDLVPNDAAANLFLGFYLTWAGRGGDGIAPIERAIRLNPFSEGQDRTFLGFALTSAGRHGEAIEVFAAERELGIRLSAFALAYWTAALTESGRTGEAEALAKEILARFPTFTVTLWGTTLRYKDAAEADPHLNALRKASLPN